MPHKDKIFFCFLFYRGCNCRDDVWRPIITCTFFGFKYHMRCVHYVLQQFIHPLSVGKEKRTLNLRMCRLGEKPICDSMKSNAGTQWQLFKFAAFIIGNLQQDTEIKSTSSIMSKNREYRLHEVPGKWSNLFPPPLEFLRIDFYQIQKLPSDNTAKLAEA